jgi:hypothetical protein
MSPAAWAMMHAKSIFKVVPTPNGNHGVRNNSLWAAAASSPSDILAVGQTTIHFDGTKWTAFNAPMILGDNTSLLKGVADISPTEAWAVGYVNAGLANPGQIIEQWNGTQWSVYPGPTFNPGDQPELFGVTAVSPTDIWAAGSLLTGGTQALEALYEHWDGTAWTAKAGPFFGFYEGVSARRRQRHLGRRLRRQLHFFRALRRHELAPGSDAQRRHRPEFPVGCGSIGSHRRVGRGLFDCQLETATGPIPGTHQDIDRTLRRRVINNV